MKTLAWVLLALASAGCSKDRAAEEQRRAAEAQREAETRKMQEKRALDVYEADARRSCEAEITRTKTKSVANITLGSAAVKWDSTYLTGDRSRTKQQFPASEAFVVSVRAEENVAGKRSPRDFSCQVVCLDAGYCNTVGFK